ncbi:hypothetical protein EHP00_694 [Ecytonucleospora hepatopenaei]|uniref:Uncharacterized protein n=1 Tax=Ecytonucleospora hepatopenaei TaxID=646526 RepID=A0A1W0E3T2_9MICR|nr:hypothetical protein EHP00_694 [Ecytonucleospora hepatopenaei]
MNFFNLFMVAKCKSNSKNLWQTVKVDVDKHVYFCNKESSNTTCSLKLFNYLENEPVNKKRHCKSLVVLENDFFEISIRENVDKKISMACKGCYENALVFAEFMKYALDNNAFLELKIDDELFKFIFNADKNGRRIFLPVINKQTLFYNPYQITNHFENQNILPFYLKSSEEYDFSTVWLNNYGPKKDGKWYFEYNGWENIRGKPLISCGNTIGFISIDAIHHAIFSNPNTSRFKEDSLAFAYINPLDEDFLSIKKMLLNTYIFEQQYNICHLSRYLSENNITDIDLKNLKFTKGKNIVYDLHKNTIKEHDNFKKWPIFTCISLSTLFIIVLIINVYYLYNKKHLLK